MKAIILNSGIGSRMEELTEDKPKCLIELGNGETILKRQIRLLKEHGINEFIITTGPFEEKIKKHVEFEYPDIDVKYVRNDNYKNTNYIYSMYLIDRQLIDSDVLLLHGDLVFEESVAKQIIETKYSNAVLVNKDIKLPKKDFKGRVIEERVKEISIDIHDKDCSFLIPMYKFSKEDFNKWLDEIGILVDEGVVDVYAENALNCLLDDLRLDCEWFKDEICGEVDTRGDLEKIRIELERRNA